MGDCPLTGKPKPSWYVSNHLRELSLPFLRVSKSSTALYLAGVKAGSVHEGLTHCNLQAALVLCMLNYCLLEWDK